MPVTCRRFLADSTAAAGAGAASLRPTAVRARARAQGVSPSDKIVVGVIGCNGMGFSNLRSLLRMDEVECGALCGDVDASVLERPPRRSWRTGVRSPGGWRPARRSSPRPGSAGSISTPRTSSTA